VPAALESVLVALALAIGLWPVVGRALRGKSVVVRTIGGVAWLALSSAAAAAIGLRSPAAHDPATAGRPLEIAADGYVSSRACRACHPGNYGSWYASYHRTMTQVATPESVLGDFGDVRVRGPELDVVLRRQGDEFWVGAPDGGPARRRIAMLTGSHHVQIYWAPSEDSRKLQMLPFVYLVEERRWITREGAFLEPPGQRQPYSPGAWNQVCIKCHATGGEPGYGPGGSMETSAVEFGIACEACHGPGAEHVRLQQDPAHRYRSRIRGGADPTIADPRRLPSRTSSQICGQCHSVYLFKDENAVAAWRRGGFDYRPGGELAGSRHVLRPAKDAAVPAVRRQVERDPHTFEDRYWPDGMVRVSGREYNGLIESPCYLHGDEERGILSCLSCHTLHKQPHDPRSLGEWANDQLGPGMDGDEACFACHEEYRGDPAVARHSHHEPKSSGSRCYNCHMPYTTYGLLKAIRSHQIDSPAVAASLATGRPNACNQCHLDRSLAWTARHLEEWYETPIPPLTDEERSVAASLLWLLRGDAGQRALAAWSLGWDAAREASGQGWIAPHLAQLLDDPYDAVRFIAYRSLRRLPGYHGFDFDFQGPRPARAAARMRALETWQRMEAPSGAADFRAVLLDDGGKLVRAEVEQLLARRDDRRVRLAE